MKSITGLHSMDNVSECYKKYYIWIVNRRPSFAGASECFAKYFDEGFNILSQRYWLILNMRF